MMRNTLGERRLPPLNHSFTKLPATAQAPGSRPGRCVGGVVWRGRANMGALSRRAHVGGVKENFYRGRHRLKTYVRVQESSRNVMRVRVWAETLVIQGVLFGVTTVAGMLQAWRYTYRTAWCSMEDEMESSTESASASRLRA